MIVRLKDKWKNILIWATRKKIPQRPDHLLSSSNAASGRILMLTLNILQFLLGRPEFLLSHEFKSK